MKFAKFLILCLVILNIITSAKLKADRSKKFKWFFSNIFQWERANLSITTGKDKLIIEGDIRFNERGL
jgi:hypothetical protein